MNEIEELSTSTCWSLLRDVPIGRIAMNGEHDIEVFPVNYIVDAGTLVFRTASGTKAALLDQGARVTFEVDDVNTVEQRAWSVVIKGVATVVRGYHSILDSFDVEVSTWQSGPKPTYVRVVPDSVTGRRFPIELT